MVFCLQDCTNRDTTMTYLNWGCDPLEAECESCLDAICNACSEEFKKKRGGHDVTRDDDEGFPDICEPDCDSCDLEKKPACSGCEIILQVCLDCGRNETCEFRISGKTSGDTA
jgi:hypothetical protein